MSDTEQPAKEEHVDAAEDVNGTAAEVKAEADKEGSPEQAKASDTPAGEVAKSDGQDRERGKERERSRERSRSRERRNRDREADKDFRTRSRSRSHGRRRSRSRSRDRRRHSRSRSRSPGYDRDRDSKRSGHRTRRSRFEEESDSDREERRKLAAAAAAAAAPPAAAGPFPGPPGVADPFAALRATNPAMAAMDPATAQAMVMRQQMMLQQQLLLQQQAALQAQQVMSKAAKTQSSAQRMAEKQSKAMRELFVGNLAPGVVTEQSLYQVFHSALIAAFPQAGQPGQEPVMRVTLNGRFAFVEFRLPEYATAALQLNGQIALMGNTLKIARPSSYMEPPPAITPMGLPGMPGGLPAAGFGGMPVPAPTAPGPMTGNMPGFGNMPGAVVATGAAGVADPLATAIPTPFLCVTGMVTADVLGSDDEYKEVFADLHQECSKHGAVADVKVPRPPPGQAAQLIGTEHYGKAFVQFVDVPSAQKAKEAIHGRMFAGNIVQAYHITLPSFQSIPASVTG